ncbi:MAG: DUF362 domain-containing protein [Armatimonadota bacterium]
MSTVYFASAHVDRVSRDATLPAKFDRLLAKCGLGKRFKDRSVAVKMHVGGGIGYTTIHPLFVRKLIEAIKQAGGSPFCTDGSFAVGGARDRGYTEEVLGAPIIPIGGVGDGYSYTRRIGYRSVKSLELSGNIVDAEAMLVLSHGKGHGHSGFGGAIKNIAMGCVSQNSRGHIHRLMETHFAWNEEACTHCYQCVEGCPTTAARFDDKGRFSIFDHHCRYCMHCVNACPENAIEIDRSSYWYFQRGMARAVRAVLDTFEPRRVFYVSVLTNITPLCDCWGFTTPALVPDVGILASEDIVSIEQASLDLIKAEDYIPGTLPDQMKMGGPGHLFRQIHGVDPYAQVQAAEKLGLGSSKYRLVEVK